MLKSILQLVLMAGLLAFSSCKKSGLAPPPPKTETKSASSQPSGASEFDACSLITKEEIKAIEESPVTDTKNSSHSDAGFRNAQCFYTTAEFSRSVSLAVTQPDPRATPQRDMKQFWEETFGAEGEKRREARERGEREEEEHKLPPKKIEGVGEEALWLGSRVGGALYVLKKNSLIRISVGGPDSQEKKLEKCKALAQIALGRL